jgi:type I restriction enzyme, S subunit
VKAGWEVKALGEVCTLQRGFDLPTPQRTAGIYPLVTSSGPSDTHFEYKVEGPGVVTGRSGSIGSVYFVEDHFWPLNTALYVKDFHGNDPKFVWYLLQYFDLSRFSTGAGVPTLNRNDVHGETVHAPNSTDEQKRIVEVLDAAFEGLSRARAHTETNLQNARELFESGVDEMFQSDLENWKSGQLGKLVGNVATGPFGSILHKSDYVEGQTPIVNPAHIVDGRIEPDSRKTISGEAKQRLKSYVLRKGDIVIGRRGDMGRCAVVGEKEDGWLCGTGSFFIRPNGNANSDFVAHLLRSRTYIEKLESVAGGATMPNISNKDLAELNVELPSLPQQDSYLLKIDALRSDTNELQSHYRAKLADLDALRQALLQKAFAGELT